MAFSPRILALAVLLAALLVGLAAHGCAARPAAGREPAPPSSPLTPADGNLALAASNDAVAATTGPAAATGVAEAGPVPRGGAAAEAGGEADLDLLGAVLVARRVCTLVDRRAYAAARWLFADHARWPVGLWRRLRRVRFCSARVTALRGGPAPLVVLNVRVATPSTRRGVGTLVFTLGRVTDGEWLVNAVRTPAQTRERSPSCPPSPFLAAGFAPA